MFVNENEIMEIVREMDWMFPNKDSKEDIAWSFSDCFDVVISVLKASSLKNDPKELESIVSALSNAQRVTFRMVCPDY